MQQGLAHDAESRKKAQDETGAKIEELARDAESREKAPRETGVKIEATLETDLRHLKEGLEKGPKRKNVNKVLDRSHCNVAFPVPRQTAERQTSQPVQ